MTDIGIGMGSGSLLTRKINLVATAAWEKVYNQAVTDNWLALYDPSNPNTRTIREDAATGIRYLEAIADALGNRSPISQATATAQPWFDPGRFGQLDGLNHSADDVFITAADSKPRWLMANATDWLDVPAPWTKLVMFHAISLNEMYHMFLAPNYISSYNDTTMTPPQFWAFRAAPNGLVTTVKATDKNPHIFTGIHRGVNVADELFLDSASIGSAVATSAVSETSWIVGAYDETGAYEAHGYTGASMIRADADAGAITRMQDLLHELTTIPKAA